jgi:hypothetical protein
MQRQEEIAWANELDYINDFNCDWWSSPVTILLRKNPNIFE